MDRESPEPVADAAHTLTACIAAAEALIAHLDATGPGFISGAAVASQPPWNAAVANALMDAHAGLRRLEAQVRRRVTGSVLARGGSDASTRSAIEALVNFAPTLARHHAAEVARQMDRWSVSVMSLPAVDHLPYWMPIRLSDGSATPPCPYCGTPSLRRHEAYGVVACLKPSCPAATGGRRPWAQIGRDDRGRMTWWWPDGTTQP
jgi:hypothetical protein